MFSKVKSLRLTLGFWSVMEFRFSLLSRNPEHQDFLSFNALSIVLLNCFSDLFLYLECFCLYVYHVCRSRVYHICVPLVHTMRMCVCVYHVCVCSVCTMCVCMCLYHVCLVPLEIRRGQRYSHLWTTLNVGDGNWALGPL